MKIVIIYSPQHRKLEAAAKVLGQALQKDGHLVDYLHVGKSDRPVSVRRYDFVYLGSVATGSFGGKVPVEVSEFVKQCRGFGHAKSAAFMLKKMLFNSKGLRRLMAVLESAGSVVVDFQIVAHTSDVELLAKRLKLAL
jgi:menaquinone-dependent protoporphyrinogen IX oxidase